MDNQRGAARSKEHGGELHISSSGTPSRHYSGCAAYCFCLTTLFCVIHICISRGSARQIWQRHLSSQPTVARLCCPFSDSPGKRSQIPTEALVNFGRHPAVLTVFPRKRCTIFANSTSTSVDYELYDDENGDSKVNEVNNIKFTESTPSTAAT